LILDTVSIWIELRYERYNFKSKVSSAVQQCDHRLVTDPNIEMSRLLRDDLLLTIL
jgi:hypothetical protein